LTIIEGTVKDINGNILGYHTIHLISQQSNIFYIGGEDENDIIQTTSDYYGKYIIKFESNENFSYQVQACETNCYFGQTVGINEATTNEVDFKLDPKGTLKLMLSNLLLGDSIFYTISYQNGSNLFSSNFKITTAQISKAILILDIKANQNVNLEWDLFENNIKYSHKTYSIQLLKCDTLSYVINK